MFAFVVFLVCIRVYLHRTKGKQNEFSACFCRSSVQGDRPQQFYARCLISIISSGIVHNIAAANMLSARRTRMFAKQGRSTSCSVFEADNLLHAAVMMTSFHLHLREFGGNWLMNEKQVLHWRFAVRARPLLVWSLSFLELLMLKPACQCPWCRTHTGCSSKSFTSSPPLSPPAYLPRLWNLVTY